MNDVSPHLLIVDDDERIRGLLQKFLARNGFLVSAARDAAHARRILAGLEFDLIVMDVMMPGEDGLSLCKKVRQHSVIPIIMLTAKAEEENKIIGLEAGADDYVIKPFSPRELTARIRAVLRRGPLEHPDGTITLKDLVIDTASQRVSIAGEPIKLGPLEYRLLCFFITHKERVYNRDELLTHVWGGDAYLDERTVDVLVRRLRKQLTPHGYDSLIQTIHGSGYRFSEDRHDR